MKMDNKTALGVIIVLMVSILAMAMVSAQPLGATLTEGADERGTDPTVNSVVAGGGNTTPLNLDQTAITSIWQGFYGNVTGGITLDDGAANAFYDWTLASVSGEILATRFQVADWSQVNCTNSTQWETEETALSITSTATDGVNETFNETTHTTFTIGTSSTLTGCRSTQAYDNTGAGAYWNVLTNVNDTTVVYVAIINDDAAAFNGGGTSTADYEILVPVNTGSGIATYYFYAELD